MKADSLTMLAVGDVILEKPNGEFFLSLAAPVLKTGSIVVGNGEAVFTSRGINTFIEMFPSSWLSTRKYRCFSLCRF